MKRANASTAVTVAALGNTVVSIRKDRTYDIDESPFDEVAKQAPDLFETLDDSVEEATANPGTKRTTKRPAAKKTAPAK